MRGVTDLSFYDIPIVLYFTVLYRGSKVSASNGGGIIVASKDLFIGERIIMILYYSRHLNTVTAVKTVKCGNFRCNYSDARGNNIEVVYNDFIKIFKSLEDQYFK
jgi:hypothetical protein